jgi:hypothetical protein
LNAVTSGGIAVGLRPRRFRQVGSFVICLHWDQFLALFGFGQQAAEFLLRWKQPPLPVSYHVVMGLAALTFLVLPYCEEFYRCWRAAGRRAVPIAEPSGIEISGNWQRFAR